MATEIKSLSPIPEAIFFTCSRCHKETDSRLKYKMYLPYRGNVGDPIAVVNDICLSCFFLIKRNFRGCVYA